METATWYLPPYNTLIYRYTGVPGPLPISIPILHSIAAKKTRITCNSQRSLLSGRDSAVSPSKHLQVISPIIHAAVEAAKRTLDFGGKVRDVGRFVISLSWDTQTQLFYSRQAEKLKIKHNAKVPR